MFYVVIASEIDNTQRNLIQEAVKQLSENWWHQWTDVWVLESNDDFKFISERLLPFAGIYDSELLILAVKDSPGGRFAARMNTNKASWFVENMVTDPAPWGEPDPWAEPARRTLAPSDSSDPWGTPSKPNDGDPWGSPNRAADDDPWAAPKEKPPWE